MKLNKAAVSSCLGLVLVFMQMPYGGSNPTSPEGLAEGGYAEQVDYGDPSSYIPGQIIVSYVEDADLDGLDAISDDITRLCDESDNIEIATIDLVDGVAVDEAISMALSEPGVIAAQPDYLYSCLEMPDDPDLSLNPTGWWWLDTVRAYDAWDEARVNGAITVAVLDSGVDVYHEDLQANLDLTHAWDANRGQLLLTSISEDNDDLCGEFSPSAHGTHVAGVIAAEANNGRGGIGISYNATILPIRVYDSDMLSSTSVIIRAYSYLIGLRTSHQIPGLRVINMSFGTAYNPLYPDQALHNKIIEATDVGILSVAAAGNGNRTDTIYPSDWPEVLSVISTTSNDTRSPTSDYGPNKDICAPGTGIRGAYWAKAYPSEHTGYTQKSGTSAASAVVAGITALIWSVDPEMTVATVRRVVIESADTLGPNSDGLDGYGRVNAHRAVLQAIGMREAPVFEPLDGFYTISYGTNRSMAMDVRGASTANMAAITVWTGIKTVAQVFQLIYDKSDGCYVIINPYSGKVVDVPGGNAYQGADIWQWQPNGLDCQKWRLLENPDGSYRIVTKLNAELCLDVPGGLQTPGLQIRLWGFNNTVAQRFWLSDRLEKRVTPGVYSIALAAAPYMVVDVLGESVLDRANVNLWSSIGNNAQRFRISFDPRYGMYQMINIGSNRAVDVCGIGYASGTNVWQWSQNGLLSQRWYIEPAMNGSVMIYAAHSGMALDAVGGQTANGTNIWVYTPNGSGAQRWLLKSA